MRDQPVRSAQDQLDLWRTLAKKMVLHLRTAAIIAVVGAAIAITFAMVKTRRYKSETVLLYREGVRWSYLGASDLVDPGRRLGQRLRDLTMSRTVLQKVIEVHGLYPAIVEREGMHEAVEVLRKDITFKVGESETITLGYETTDALLAQKVTAFLADQIIAQSQRLRLEQATVTSEFLDTENLRSEETLRARETAYARFLAEHPQFAQDAQSQAGGPSPAAGARGAPVARAGDKPPETGLSALEREAARLRTRIAGPTATAPITPAPPKAPAPVDPKLAADRRTAETELATAQRALAEAEGKYTPQHPDTRAAATRATAAQQRVAQIDSEIRARQTVDDDPISIPAGPVSSADKKALETRLAGVEAAIAKARVAAGKPDKPGDKAAEQDDTTRAIVALETDWQRLGREVAEAREHNKQIQDKRFLASVAASSATQGSSGQLLIVDPAFKPIKPVGVGRSRIALFGLAVSIPFALGVALLLALMDDRLYLKGDVERLAMVPVVGVVPKASRRG